MIKVLVADDHSIFIDGIKTTLCDVKDIVIIAKAFNGYEVLKELESKKIDIVLMDISMPLMDGIECTRIINEKFPKTNVIALSQFAEKRFVKRMIKYGANGYLLKDANKAELVNAIREVYAGNKYFSPKLSANILNEEYLAKNNNPLFPRLTDREREVLSLICKEFSGSEIADTLHISYNTVENHRANLMDKAGAKNTAGLVKWAVQNDLID
jgi:DNA-binding NarL/FixJ family response regulator